MAKTNLHNDDDASPSSSRKRFKTFDDGGLASFLDLNRDILFLVMMRLGVFDFFAFSGVCKSWRSLALANRNRFMASKPPMSICRRDNDQESYWYLEDFKGTRFITRIPLSGGRTCVGLTCGYLILFRRETRDFRLLNPITRHGLHFPDYPFYVGAERGFGIRAILLFSPSISGWVFVVLHRPILFCETGTKQRRKVSFSIAGKQGWNHVSSTLPILDLLAFKGKIYILHNDCSLSELRLDLNRKRKWTMLKTKNLLTPDLVRPELASSEEKLYMISHCSLPQKVLELDFGEMKWVSPEKTIGEYAFFHSYLRYSAVIKPESWAGLWTKYKSCDYFFDTDKSQRYLFNYKLMWYFPHDCLNVNLLDK